MGNDLFYFTEFNLTFVDVARTREVDDFYAACRLQREYLKGDSSSSYPLAYFKKAEIWGQGDTDSTVQYLKYPPVHITYKQPNVFPWEVKIPNLPERTMAGRHNHITTSTIGNHNK